MDDTSPGPTPRATAAISLSAIGDLLPRRGVRMHSLAIVALLSGATLATALMLTGPPPAPSRIGSQVRDTGAIHFQRPESQAMTLQGLASPSAQTAPDAKASEQPPNIRIVDQPSEKVASCEDATWPYIDQRCLTTKNETGHVSAKNDVAAKIGPKPIDSRPPLATVPDQPIGSMTAIAPAYPRVDATDGVSSEPPEARSVAPDQTEPIAEPAMKVRKPVRVRHAAVERSERASVNRRKAKEKTDRADAGAPRRYYYRPPPTDHEPGPSFFFPSGLFSQMR